MAILISNVLKICVMRVIIHGFHSAPDTRSAGACHKLARSVLVASLCGWLVQPAYHALLQSSSDRHNTNHRSCAGHTWRHAYTAMRASGSSPPTASLSPSAENARQV